MVMIRIREGRFGCVGEGENDGTVKTDQFLVKSEILELQLAWDSDDGIWDGPAISGETLMKQPSIPQRRSKG